MRRLTDGRVPSNMLDRAPYLLALGTIAILGCWQKLDSNASNDFSAVSGDPNGGIGAPFQVVTTTPKIGVTADPNTGDPDPATETDDPCVKVKADSVEVRHRNCKMCHQDSESGGLTNIESDDSLVNVTSASGKYPGWKYVVPGDPLKSLIYHRVVILGDMPPPSTIDSPVAHPNISDMSVLQEWIKCLGPAPASTGAGGSPGGGGSTGAGGVTGGGVGGKTGTGGMAAGTGGATGTMMADAGTDSGGMMTGSDGAIASPCTGIQNCNSPTQVAALPFNTTVTGQQACFEISHAVSAINCNNATGRRITVNTTQFAVNNAGMCNGTLPAARNGGFCVQVNAFGGAAQPPSTTLNIL